MNESSGILVCHSRGHFCYPFIVLPPHVHTFGLRPNDCWTLFKFLQISSNDAHFHQQLMKLNLICPSWPLVANDGHVRGKRIVKGVAETLSLRESPIEWPREQVNESWVTKRIAKRAGKSVANIHMLYCRLDISNLVIQRPQLFSLSFGYFGTSSITVWL